MIRQLIDEAVAAGARRKAACEILGLTARTVEQWADHDDDRRCGPNTVPANKLSELERRKLIAVATSPEFRDQSPKQIVPRLADRGEYLASESTFYRVLHAEAMQHHRACSRPPVARPHEHTATAPWQRRALASIRIPVELACCERGFNGRGVAMRKVNHNIFGVASEPPHESRPRVFLSHRRDDKGVTREIAAYFELLGLYYYFDEQDVVLNSMLACGHTEARAIVEAIEDGLRHCSHLLGIVSMQTMGSWWVPYEIGCARTRGYDITYLIIGDVTPATLPEFIRIVPSMTSAVALFAWAKPLVSWPDSFVRSQSASWWAGEGDGLFGELGPGEDAAEEWAAMAERKNRDAMEQLESVLQQRRVLIDVVPEF